MTSFVNLLGSILVCCAFLLMTAHASAQDTKTRKTTAGSGVSIMSYKEIPAATEPCTSEECDWWTRLREAGNKLLRKGDQKSMSAYASLFVEGIAKSYKVPLADSLLNGRLPSINSLTELGLEISSWVLPLRLCFWIASFPPA